METTQLPLPFQILLAALIEACHGERSQLQIAFINELQQLQPQPQPNGGDTSSQAVQSLALIPRCQMLWAARVIFPSPDPKLYPGPTPCLQTNTRGWVLPQTSPEPLKFTQRSRPGSCCCSLSSVSSRFGSWEN